MTPAARGNLLTWLWHSGSAYRDRDMLDSRDAHSDHEARYHWLYARGGQDTLVQLTTGDDE